ncbi:MAG: hypothetical protein JNK46_12995, partial [Methylobacteriaceae bacterium]|nr:hypothetical protein [Methylobacteriaceae bacterium]
EMWRLEPRRERLWIAPAFSRVAFVSDVGPTLALCNPGANLLPLEATGASVVVAFWRDGALKREVRLSEVMEPGRLRRTVSHYAWAHLQGFDARGRLRLETVDGERVLLEP